VNKTLEKLRAKFPVTIVAVGDSNYVICRHTKGRFNWFHHLHLNAQGHLAMFRELSPHFGIPKHFTYEEPI